MPKSPTRSFQRYPLTSILGAEARVRVLRELSRHGGLLSAPSLVRRCRLAGSSVRSALAGLEETGIVASEGSGRIHLYRVRAEHPLATSLGSLFEAEEVRFASIRKAIRSAASDPCVLAVWIYGSVARGEDRPDSDLDVIAIVERDALERVVMSMREALFAPGELLGFVPSVVGLTREDAVRLSSLRDPWWESVVADSWSLLGAWPNELVPEAGG